MAVYSLDDVACCPNASIRKRFKCIRTRTYKLRRIVYLDIRKHLGRRDFSSLYVPTYVLCVFVGLGVLASNNTTSKKPKQIHVILLDLNNIWNTNIKNTIIIYISFNFKYGVRSSWRPSHDPPLSIMFMKSNSNNILWIIWCTRNSECRIDKTKFFFRTSHNVSRMYKKIQNYTFHSLNLFYLFL